MQEKIETEEKTDFFQQQILTIDQQRDLMKCPNHNQATYVCISASCQISGLMCLDPKCQCRQVHLKCHHTLLNRVLLSIEKHQKQIPQVVKQSYKTVYDKINDMIEKLSKLRAKFELQQQYFGLRDQQLQFMELINNNTINEINGKMISGMEKTFQTQITLNTNSKEQILKDFEEKNKVFEKLCNQIESQYSFSKQKTQINFDKTLFQDSSIVKTNQDKSLLFKWLKQESNKKQAKLTSKLLFRASQHQYKASKFHQKCDGIKNTFVIIKNQFDRIIGGFTEKEWKNVASQYIKDVNNKAFLFSINLKEKYKCQKPQYSIYNANNYGPVFGGNGGNDIYIADNCNDKNSNTGANMHTSYNNQNNYKHSQQTNKRFKGGEDRYKFSVKEYQVYQIIGL